MKFAAASVLALSALSTQVAGQAATDPAAYAAGLLQALSAANLSTLVSIATANAPALLPALISGNKTVFAPSNAAFAQLPNSTLSNTTAVLELIQYHVLQGSFELTPNNTIARSSLNTTGIVNLPGGVPQAVVLRGNATRATVVQANSTINSTAATTYENLRVFVVPRVLSIPGSLTSTLSALGLSSLVGAATSAAPALPGALNAATGITLFAPSNSAFSSAQALLGTLDATAVGAVLANHVLNGTVLYSSQITDGAEVISAGGQAIRATVNATGVFVTSGNATARVIRTDALTNNGVIHVIDGILANPLSDPAAAASAASSAAGAASTQTAAPTGAVGGGGATGGTTPPATTSRAPGARTYGMESGKAAILGAITGLLALAGGAAVLV